MAELYLISPAEIQLDAFVDSLKQACAAGKIGAFQLRLKSCGDEEIIQAGKRLLPICHNHGIQFILNDRADLALEIGADGVHLGEEDGEVEKARALLGEDKIIGVSCYNSIDRALDLAEKGADYVSFGAFYPTKTKNAKTRAEPKLLKWWVENTTTPCVAIGGINAENVSTLIEAGADLIAVISYVWEHPRGAGEGVKELGGRINPAPTMFE